MKTFYLYLLFSLTILYPFREIKAQEYNRGTITFRDGKVAQGQLMILPGWMNCHKAVFRSEGESKQYSAADLSAYSIGKLHYTAVDSVRFMQVLTSGEISVLIYDSLNCGKETDVLFAKAITTGITDFYKSGYSYYLKKDEKLICIQTNEDIKQKLASFFEEYPELEKFLMKKESFESELPQYAVIYNDFYKNLKQEVYIDKNGKYCSQESAEWKRTIEYNKASKSYKVDYYSLIGKTTDSQLRSSYAEILIYECEKFKNKILDLSGLYLLSPDLLTFPAHTEILLLSDCHLNKFPNAVFDLSNLKSLNLSQNNIKEIPPDIARNGNLESIDLSKNEITVLAKEIFYPAKLNYLDLSYNRFPTIPKNIDAAKNLKEIYILSSELKSLPDGFFSLKKLEKTDAVWCKNLDKKTRKRLNNLLINTENIQ